MNKQLMLLATLVATQASVNATESRPWVPESLTSAAHTTKEYVAETVVPFAKVSWESAKDNCSNVKQFLTQIVKPEPTRFEAFKTSVSSMKDSVVSYFGSFNKSAIPSWETTKNFAFGLKDSTSAAIQQACTSIKENAPVYFEAAKNYAQENPNKVAAVTVGSIAALIVMYKTVKYLRNSDEFYRDCDAIVEPVKHAFRIR